MTGFIVYTVMLSIGREEKALHIKLTQTDVQVQVGPA